MKKITKKFKATGKLSLFAVADTTETLAKLGNILNRLERGVDFERFRSILEDALTTDSKSNAGARPYNYLLMFQILILQYCYGLSDEQTEYQIYDRLSFKNFLKLSDGDKVPDAKTIWAFREKVSTLGLANKLFSLFNEFLKASGLILSEGKMVDASFTTVPIQRNTKEENTQIKAGSGEELWNAPHEKYKKRQKDTEARWTKKNNTSHYGYKNHTKVDTASKLITNYIVTDASVHDSQALSALLSIEDKDQTLHADSAYIGEEQEKIIAKAGMINKVHEKGARNRPLTDEQKASNRDKSRKRVRVEHVYGFIKNTMSDLSLRCIGLQRVATGIGFINLIYNIFRVEQLQRITLSKS